MVQVTAGAVRGGRAPEVQETRRACLYQDVCIHQEQMKASTLLGPQMALCWTVWETCPFNGKATKTNQWKNPNYQSHLKRSPSRRPVCLTKTKITKLPKQILQQGGGHHRGSRVPLSRNTARVSRRTASRASPGRGAQVRGCALLTSGQGRTHQGHLVLEMGL